MIALRLFMLSVLLGYQFAGASLVLPAESRCARCAKSGATGAVKSGASCPLSYHGHDCHNSGGKVTGHITVCPDGCLRHHGQDGEVPSPAKFLSAPEAFSLRLLSVGSAPEAEPFVRLDLPLSPPDRPPSSSY